MPRDGSGVYSAPAGSNTVTAGTTILSSLHNSLVNDLVSDANTARPITAGGTGSTSASAARTALGLAIGSDVQAYDADTAKTDVANTWTAAQSFSGGYSGGAIATLVGGSNFGGLLQGASGGHLVIGIQDNDSGDSFSIVSGDGNFTSDSTYDKLVAQFKGNGSITLNGAGVGGTSGAALPRLDNSNSWSAGTTQTFLGNVALGNGGDSITINGSDVTFSSSAATYGIVVRVPDGTVSAPAIALASNTDVGLYAVDVNTLGYTINGTHIGHLNSTGWTVSNTSGATTFGSVDAVKNLISGGGQIDVTNTQSGSACRLSRTTDGNVIQYHKGATLRGSHSVNDTGTTFNNTSDGNLKIDRVPLEQELDLDAIHDALGALAFTMLNSETLQPIDGRLYGQIAQDVYAFVPLRHLVTVGHGVPGDKDYSPWMLDYTGLHTVLIACVRHRQKKLEARLDAAGL